MKRVQIIKLKDGRWEFVAHGAAYTKVEAVETRAQIEANGYPTRTLPCK